MLLLFFKQDRYYLKWLRLLLFFVFISINVCGQVNALRTANLPAGNTLDVHFLNVGQGNCVLIKFPSGRYMLYDAGTSTSKNVINRAAVAARVAAITGGAAITTVVLSHPDKDHVNIVPLITQAANPRYVHYSGVPADYNKYLKNWFAAFTPATTLVSYPVDYPPLPVNYNPSAQIDGAAPAQVYILSANETGDPNTRSVVIKIVFQNTSVLLTGDATAATEATMLGKWPAAFLKSTVILFSHHGSNYSSITPFITAVNPNIGVWSASATHRGYGHPRCDVLPLAGSMVDSTTKNGVTIPAHTITCFNTPNQQYVNHIISYALYLTARQGEIKFSSDGTNYSITVNSLN